MAEILANKSDLFKLGYCVVRNVLNDNEIQKYTTITDELNKKKRMENNSCTTQL